MKKATPVEMKTMMDAVLLLKKAGIPFVPVPALDDADNDRLVADAAARLEYLMDLAELGADGSTEDKVYVHESHKGMVGCDHDWVNQGEEDMHCSNCGMSIYAHASLEMP